MRADPTRPSAGLYIKLGRGGKYERICIEEDQSLRLGYGSAPHQLCVAGEWDRVHQHLEAERGSSGVASRDVTQIKHFYEADETVLWVTFYGDRLYWCFSRPEIELLPDGTKRRPVIGRWRSRDIRGEPLEKSRLSGKLLSMEGFRGTICSVREFQYLQQKINGRVPEDVRRAEAALSELEQTVETLIHNLYWMDFEILVDLVFRQAGWHRVSELGKRLKTLDLDLISPLTAERYGVQVKSEADLAEFEAYQTKFTDMQGYSRLYFVVHSPAHDLREAKPAEDVELWLPDDIARWVVRYGLAEWVIDKTS